MIATSSTQINFTIESEPFTPMHLLRLVEAVESINDKDFTAQVARALLLIHAPVHFITNDSNDEKTQ